MVPRTDSGNDTPSFFRSGTSARNPVAKRHSIFFLGIPMHGVSKKSSYPWQLMSWLLASRLIFITFAAWMVVAEGMFSRRLSCVWVD